MKTKMLLVALALLFVLPSAFAQRDRFDDRRDGRWDNRHDSRLEWEVRNQLDQLRFLGQGRAIENLTDRELMFVSEQLNRTMELLRDAERRDRPHPGPGPSPFPGPGPGPSPFPGPGPGPSPFPGPGPGPSPFPGPGPRPH